MTPSSAVCRLCLELGPLSNSHVLPEFLFKAIYDERHKAVEIRKGGNTQTIQKGWRERLLCAECEGRLSSYETYFANELFERIVLPDELAKDAEVVRVDYTKFKLFHVSILWRASVSTLRAFTEVNLGAKWEKLAREMLLNGIPGPPSHFPIFAVALCDTDGARVGDRMIWNAQARRVRGHRIYTFLFRGFIWHYVASGTWPRELLSFCLPENGLMPFMREDVNRYESIAYAAKLFKAATTTTAPG